MSTPVTQATDLINEEDLTNPNRPARIGLMVIALGLGGFLLWASLVPLAEGVPTSGLVSIDTKRRVVQHLQGGLIREVHVREGQLVKEGDLLMRLDDSAARANFEQARQNLAALQENRVAQEAVLKGLEAAEANRREQLRLVVQELNGVRSLVKEGFAPVVQQLQLERTKVDVETALSDLQTSQQRTRQALLEIQHQSRAAEQRLLASTEDMKRLELRAPASGQVVGLAVQSVGAIIQPAQRVLEVVPKEETLIIEAQVPPQFIDRIREGDAVDLRFSSFSRSPQLVVSGQLLSVSKDVLTDPNGAPFYFARVVVTPQGLKDLGDRNLQAGMPVEVIIKTGSRTMLNYLISPLTKRVAASLKEE
jgi:protease secretion system membrane fusion protein